MRMALSDNMRGAGLMMVAMAAFTFNDTVMKTLSGEVPLFQAIFLRGALTTLLLFALGRAMGGLRFRLARRDWGAIALRTFCEGAATFLFLTALFHAPIANVTAILQSLPLTVALGAALFLGEPLGWRRIVAILVGFAGVLLIVRPGGDGFTIWSLYALAAVGFVTIRDLAVRRMSVHVPSLTVALVGAASITLAAGAVALVQGWQPVTPRQGGTMALAALFIMAGYLSSVMTMRQGEIGFVAPFRYTGILWALILGWLVFGDWPDTLTLIGAAIVVAMGLFTLWRERKSRAARTPG
ncbi:MAG TPA: DMT family transporter [Aliiroseovarius sp.]|nr:DMT family transporter [Aliiroseovarius sp.]